MAVQLISTYELERARSAECLTDQMQVLKVESTESAKLELKPLSWTEGVAVGSTLIDYKARRVLIDRLRPIQDEIPGDLETVISGIVDDQFRTFKCSFGVEGMVGCYVITFKLNPSAENP